MNVALNDSYSSHTVFVDAVAIKYRYHKGRFGGFVAPHDHFEFLSYLVSNTGYLSHFVHSSEVDVCGGHEAFAIAFSKAMMAKTKKVKSCQADVFESF